jgi:Ferritin-like domain
MFSPTRRRVLAAGFAGTVLGLAGDRVARAGTTPPTDETTGDTTGDTSETSAPQTTSAPSRPTPSDLVLLQFSMSMEMSARDLYQTSLDAGSDDPLVSVLRNNHRSYVDILRAILGTSAVDRRNEQLYDEFVTGFEQTDLVALAETAYDLESTAVATNTELLRSIQNIDAARRIASIIVVEAQSCTVLADAGGRGDDLDALFVNDAEPLPATQAAGG